MVYQQPSAMANAGAADVPLTGATVEAHEFYWSESAEPHTQRRREILAKYGPQVRALYGHDASTAVQVRMLLIKIWHLLRLSVYRIMTSLRVARPRAAWPATGLALQHPASPRPFRGCGFLMESS